MKNNFPKILHIINSLLYFCHSAGAVSCDVHLEPCAELASITISAAIPNLSSESFEELSGALKLPRTHELEQNYWEICGEAGSTSDLTLIGIMLDASVASYEDGVLTIEATRKS